MARHALLLFALFVSGSVLAQAPRSFQLSPAPLPALLPAPPTEEVNPREDLLTFDPRLVELVWRDHRWQVLCAGQVLKDFGRRESEARQALLLMQQLGLSQRGSVGNPRTVMEYWLVDGRGPSGLTPGLRRLPLDTTSLRIEQRQSQWCVRDEQRVLFSFGPHEDEARRALSIVHKYRFTQLGILGQAVPSMMILFTEEGELPSPNRSLITSRLRPTSERQSSNQGNNTPPAAPAVLPPLGATATLPGRRGLAAPSRSTDEQAEVVSFDARQVQVHQDNGSWVLAAGDYVLARFGPDEAAAQQALGVARHYHFTEHCRVGRPVPAFCYFLVSGQAPRGLMFGLSGQAFQYDKLSVQPLGRQWALCEGDKVLMVLGANVADAHQLLAAIQHNRFDRLCHVGPESEGMTFFVRVH
jgi:hypothetical protein